MAIVGEQEALPLRSVPGLDWRVFVAGPFDGRRHEPSTIAVPTGMTVHADDGALLARVDLGWALESPCDPVLDECPRPWAKAVDATAAETHPGLAAGRAELAERVALDDPVVREVLDGKRYVVEAVGDWRTCSGESFGAILTVLFPRPISIDGEFPFSGYDEKSRSAYVAGRWRIAADGVAELNVYVDLELGRVVGIEPMGDHIQVRSYEVVQPLRPAGGPDDPEDC